MTAPRPEIQRLEFYVEDDGDRDPWAVPHNDPTGDYVRHSDHLRAVTLAKIEALECARRCIVCCAQVTAAEELALKIAALRKELGE